jgi:glycosyltransferase involved in cell wall biosynthesis
MPRVAVIHEWLASWAGSERVLGEILHCFPEADLFTLVDFLPEDQRAQLAGHRIQTSFLQGLPLARSRFRAYLPLMPLAIEQFDLSGYDLIISSSHAVAKGVLTQPGQVHISYVHTPMRYAWCLEESYLSGAGLLKGLRRIGARPLLHYLRQWDAVSTNRVDRLLANSRYVAARIWKTYRRQSEVVYPPVDVHRFDPSREREDFYLCVSRLVPYKRVDLIVSAFTQLGLPLVLIGNGPELKRVMDGAGPNITYLGHQPDEAVRWHQERCRAFVIAADEDFGITSVEAQAAGAPVIALARGGSLETVLHQETGVLFDEQTQEGLADAVAAFHGSHTEFDPQTCRQNAEQFSVERFRIQLVRAVAGELAGQGYALPAGRHEPVSLSPITLTGSHRDWSGRLAR